MLAEVSVCLGHHKNSNAYKTFRVFDGLSWPPVNTSLLDGELAWRQHDGGHEDRSNMKYFIAWAGKLLKHSPPMSAATK